MTFEVFNALSKPLWLITWSELNWLKISFCNAEISGQCWKEASACHFCYKGFGFKSNTANCNQCSLSVRLKLVYISTHLAAYWLVSFDSASIHPNSFKFQILLPNLMGLIFNPPPPPFSVLNYLIGNIQNSKIARQMLLPSLYFFGLFLQSITFYPMYISINVGLMVRWTGRAEWPFSELLSLFDCIGNPFRYLSSHVLAFLTYDHRYAIFWFLNSGKKGITWQIKPA